MTISFDLPAGTRQLLAELREWSLHEVRPLARTADTLETKVFEAGKRALESCPIDMSPLAVPELGLVRSGGGKRYRASDSDDDNHVLGVLAMEAMCYGDGWAWGALPRNANLEKILSVIGTPQQLERWETPPGEQPIQSSFAFTEEHCGSDISAIRTQAVRDGDEWVINGRKRFSSQGAEATVMLVFVTVDPARGMSGLRGVMVPQDSPGIKILRETEERKLGMRYLRQSTIEFEDVRVPYDHMLGDPDDPKGFLEGLNVLNRTRPFCMAWNVGTLRGATDYVGDWVKSQTPGFNARRRQRIEEDLGEIRASMDDLMRLLVNAAWKADHGLPHRTEAAMAKSHGPRIVERGYRRLVQIMGSEGSSERHLLEKWYRDAVCFDLLEGTSQILKLTVGRGIFAAANRELETDIAAALRPVSG
ncbi:acyl-CoA dehydrogenase family protein [Amycolatopsis methanolica]|uniref:Acyl-CoA dehydrogenase n=1 Tax=Amycolatopsis methanolica 239 TaxID=1068978 RepID=A0A076MU03_AMYME|nr:acyl-CoA dehydrogenase [Amycolatopsis methanolica]AIJ21287.1 acyl-CoA dehydrogenase [Amycolatopsis methanolica 239]